MSCVVYFFFEQEPNRAFCGKEQTYIIFLGPLYVVQLCTVGIQSKSRIFMGFEVQV